MIDHKDHDGEKDSLALVLLAVFFVYFWWCKKKKRCGTPRKKRGYT